MNDGILCIVPSAWSTWDATRMGPSITLSNGNRTATWTASINQGVALQNSKSSGAYYFEILLSNLSGAGTSFGAGLVNPSQTDFANFQFNHGFIWFCGIGDNTSYTNDVFTKIASTGFSLANGGILQLAIDITNGSVWFGYNNTWDQGVTPVVGSTTGRNWSFTGSTSVTPAIIEYYTGVIFITNATAVQQTYSPPSGFSAWG